MEVCSNQAQRWSRRRVIPCFTRLSAQAIGGKLGIDGLIRFGGAYSPHVPWRYRLRVPFFYPHLIQELQLPNSFIFKVPYQREFSKAARTLDRRRSEYLSSRLYYCTSLGPILSLGHFVGTFFDCRLSFPQPSRVLVAVRCSPLRATVGEYSIPLFGNESVSEIRRHDPPNKIIRFFAEFVGRNPQCWVLVLSNAYLFCFLPYS